MRLREGCLHGFAYNRIVLSPPNPLLATLGTKPGIAMLSPESLGAVLANFHVESCACLL
jgi:hypothetical protein